ncbi:MAG: tRNA pseudouridine(55) synthase TruB [Boseongicola sp. SB0676_bin_33]|uniref:tRNA pseudouridine synthase B n=1 Tax=Boseongicola sp. SB0664_bin_43 TaxID=2604844 RepID=A0A6B0XWZ2_9RHOB|nr:tRNA pseudouridine(55) synthase TruB [Boseongicola sp. SB0664_bin_43]MYF88633.1 tRNA pseudouridine(55) synthase TruB [Boseongicola sp. SB0676_bin_33]MYK31098.1 tRNA pseudouridine(55) synthase TruB [Boseongicola sp. SB0670_bin_30]
MARRKKGRNISGWLPVDKPPGPTSTAVVNKIRWALDSRKAGHAGTLDPAASGLLAVAFGEATKTIPYVTDASKAYRFTIRLGRATDTGDAEGEVIATSDVRPDDEALLAALAALEGGIEQVPPAFSAIKIDGKRAYDRARAGEDVQVAPRPVHVESLSLVDRPDSEHVTLEMVCGKGVYVRSVARDLGHALGTEAHVVRLRRTWSGPFHVDQAVALDRIEALARTPEIDALILPLESGLANLAQAQVSEQAVVRIRNGSPGQVIATDAAFGERCWAAHRGSPVAIGTYLSGEFHPDRVFRS